MTQRKARRSKKSRLPAQFAAESAYAESIFRTAVGDAAASIAALQAALMLKPDYAPAILSMGSIEYQRRRRANGKRFFLSLLSLPQETEDLCKIIDEAGSFLIGVKEYADGLELYRKAARKFPDIAELQQGLACCAGHEGVIDEALAASRRAIDLDPNNAVYVSDLGWTSVLAERFQEAEVTFQQALAMDPTNEHAKANLEYCREKMAEKGDRENGVQRMKDSSCRAPGKMRPRKEDTSH
jgi:tetratricopeptide (TPR) repeat protein